MTRAFIAGACRTAIGNFGGSLQKIAPADLGQVAAKEACVRAGIDPAKGVDEVIVGNVLGAGHGMNMARQVALKAGLPVSTPAYTVNKVCGSGLKAVCLAAQQIQAGGATLILAGGVESMSQAAFVSKDMRWGARLGHAQFVDLLLQDGLTDAFHGCHMGITAENLADKYKISRDEQDEFAVLSQRKAAEAIKAGLFATEIVAVPTPKKGAETATFAVDEYPRAETNKESLAKLKPAFKKDGTVTAGNASGVNDGAAMLLVASESEIKRQTLTPLAEIVGFASAGVEPELMGIGPVLAVQKLLQQTGVKLSDIDWIEANEAFAVQSLAVSKELEFDTAKVNPLGGAIALGHPIGASGARILVTLIHQLRRTKKSLGLATLCVGGGQGIAILVRTI